MRLVTVNTGNITDNMLPGGEGVKSHFFAAPKK